MTELKPKVIVNGGFHKNGAIVEGDQGVEYQRTVFDRVDFNLKIEGRSITFSKEEKNDSGEEIDELTNEDKRLLRLRGEEDNFQFDKQLKKYTTRREYLFGKAQINENRYGEYSFSIFGSDREFSELYLRIERSETDRLTIFGYKEIVDETGLLTDEEGFSIEMSLRNTCFDELHDSLESGHNDVHLSVSISAPKFYATWSQINNYGRVIKYLDSADDLENPKDFPEHFDDRHPLSMEFSLHIGERFFSAIESEERAN